MANYNRTILYLMDDTLSTPPLHIIVTYRAVVNLPDGEDIIISCYGIDEELIGVQRDWSGQVGGSGTLLLHH